MHKYPAPLYFPPSILYLQFFCFHVCILNFYLTCPPSPSSPSANKYHRLECAAESFSSPGWRYKPLLIWNMNPIIADKDLFHHALPRREWQFLSFFLFLFLFKPHKQEAVRYERSTSSSVSTRVWSWDEIHRCYKLMLMKVLVERKVCSSDVYGCL